VVWSALLAITTKETSALAEGRQTPVEQLLAR
jgi:hypothetical protein